MLDSTSQSHTTAQSNRETSSKQHSLGMQCKIYSCAVSPFFFVVFPKASPYLRSVNLPPFFSGVQVSDNSMYLIVTLLIVMLVCHPSSSVFPLWESNPTWCAVTGSHCHVFLLSKWVCLETCSVYRCISHNHALNFFAQVSVNLYGIVFTRNV